MESEGEVCCVKHQKGYEYKRDSPVYLKVFMVDFYHLIQLSFNYSLKEK